ncbi:MAG TPA: BON domain-containing protein [Clostridia bacterium]|nr:BON domain-containing protein [Clostridia bacterium]
MKAKGITSLSAFGRSEARIFVLLALVLIFGLATACNRNPLGSSKNDSQIASEVQTKVMSDPNITSRQISVQAANGVVTLGGYVNSDQERGAAATAASQVEGVKTVVNNLQVSTAGNTQLAPADQQEQSAAAPVQEPAREPARRSAQRATSTRGSSASQTHVPDYSNSSSSSASTATTPAPATPVIPAAPVIQKVTVPDGTTLAIRLIDAVDSEKSQPGDTFRATLNSPIVVDDNIVIPADADVEGRVVDAKSAGRFKGQSALAIELTKISINGRGYQIRTNQWAKQGTSRGKNTAAKVGGGAALGAIIGGLAGGGKGAAIGATVGAGAGTGVQAATHGQQIKLGPEALLTFRLESPVTVIPASQANRRRLE